MSNGEIDNFSCTLSFVVQVGTFILEATSLTQGRNQTQELPVSASWMNSVEQYFLTHFREVIGKHPWLHPCIDYCVNIIAQHGYSAFYSPFVVFLDVFFL